MPLAEASVAVVIGFTWQGQRGVFKLLKPEIERALDEELAILDPLGAFLDERRESLGLPAVDYRETLAQVRQLLAHEIRLDFERRASRGGRSGAQSCTGRPRTSAPAISDAATAGDGASRWPQGDGRRFDVDDGTPANRPVGRRGTHRHAGLVSRAAGLFHSDPHAGNLMIDSDGCLAPIDWCLASHLDLTSREAIPRVLVGAIMRDTGAILAALEGLAVRPVRWAALHTIVERNVRALAPIDLPCLSWTMHMLDEAVTSAGLRVGAPLLAFRKALLTLDGVLHDIAPDLSVDQSLVASFLPRLVAEWPWRALVSPVSRALPSRISSVDLAQVATALTLAWLPLWSFPPFAASNG